MPPCGVKRVFLTWQTKLDLLRDYKEKYGHASVPKTYVDPQHGFFLGKWVQNLRQNRKQNPERISSDCLKQLDELGFVWSKYDENRCDSNRWDYLYDLLLDYRKQYPNTWPKPREMYKNENLGNWLQQARRGYRQSQRGVGSGKKHSISQDRVNRLNAIGFVWNFEAPRKLVRDYDYMISSTITTIRPEMNIQDALQMLSQNNISEAPVVERNTNRLVGYVRLWDIIHKQASQGSYKQPGKYAKLDVTVYRYVHVTKRVANFPTVAYVMTYLEDMEVVTPKTFMSRVAAIMARDKIQQLPVIDDESGILLGIMKSEHVLKDFIRMLHHLPPKDKQASLSNKYDDDDDDDNDNDDDDDDIDPEDEEEEEEEDMDSHEDDNDEDDDDENNDMDDDDDDNDMLMKQEEKKEVISHEQQQQEQQQQQQQEIQIQIKEEEKGNHDNVDNVMIHNVQKNDAVDSNNGGANDTTTKVGIVLTPETTTATTINNNNVTDTTTTSAITTTTTTNVDNTSTNGYE